jgi:hypothetical protein
MKKSTALAVPIDLGATGVGTAPGAQPSGVHPTRSFALHSAVYDAVVSVAGGGHPCLLSERGPRGARPDAAAGAAGHDALAALYPGATGVLDELLAAELTAMPDGPAKTGGVRVGQDIAARLLGARADDGSAASGPPVMAAGVGEDAS